MKRGKPPTKAQQDFHSLVASLGCSVPVCVDGAHVHHCVGSSDKHNKIWIGQWWVIPLCLRHHQYGPESAHEGPLGFARLFGVTSRKQAEKVAFQLVLERIEKRHGAVACLPPPEVVAAIEDYRR